MNIRPATAADLDQIAAIYDTILDQEAATGINYTNWKKGVYPSRDTAREVLEAGTLYVGEVDGRVLGSVNFNGVQLPEYDRIPWSIPAESHQVGVIHTLTIHPDASGKGLGRAMVAFCEDLGRSQGKTVIRLDTWEHNLPTNHLYPALGYRLAGSTEFFFMGYVHEILNCYEKAL
jgi:ribosomal protein S18 acetylase RimI-like enzyme